MSYPKSNCGGVVIAGTQGPRGAPGPQGPEGPPFAGGDIEAIEFQGTHAELTYHDGRTSVAAVSGFIDGGRF